MSTSPITAARRRELATQLGKSDAYLYQCLANIRDMNPGEARRLEDATGGELHRRDLCQVTWAAIWPELVDAEHPASSCAQALAARSASKVAA